MNDTAKQGTAKLHASNYKNNTISGALTTKPRFGINSFKFTRIRCIK